MRRGNALYILSLASLGCGLGLAVAGPWFTGLRAAGALLLAVGGGGLALTIAMLNQSSRRVITALREAAPLPLPDRLEIPSTGFKFLNQAWGEVMEVAIREVTSAQLSAKELEIRLKVATAERRHAEAILYSISDAVLVTDPFDDLVLANESAAKAFNFDLSKATRNPLDRVLSDARMIAMIRDMRQSHSCTGRRILEHQVRSDGTDRTFKVTLSSVADGEWPAGVVTVLQDVTREREIAGMKNDFVSMVSHELRTPLASIKAYVEMLIDGEASDAKTQREFYDVIQNESNRLGRLIDNILNISRIESGLVKVHKQPISLTVVAKDAIEVIAPQAMQKQITLSEDLAAPIYQTIADRDMIYQALLNLLGNAVKYTPAGGSIAVAVVVDEAKKKISARISDTGVGIPPKDLPFVFDKFFRVEANSRMAPGTGLGLSLVKHIIEAVHQGTVQLQSQLGKGSVFGFELDLCE